MKKILVGLIVLVAALVLLPPLLAPRLGWTPDQSVIPPPGRIIEIAGGQRVNVVETGSGPAIVLVHGLPGNAYDWRPLPERLARGAHRIIRYDRIGYGHSDRRGEDEAFTLETNARELLALLDALQIDRATLVGWFYGGGIVQTAALLAPQRVRRLVLIAAVGPSYQRSTPGWIQRALRSECVVRWGLAAGFPGRAQARQESSRAFGSVEATPAWWLDHALAMMSIPGTIHSWLEEHRRLRVDGLRTEEIRVPVLVIQGENDLLVPASVGEDLHRRIAVSELLIVSRGSHMLPITHPDLLAGPILAFSGGDSGSP
jgi:pimeloyl-ACP methyl ester carboxylesterase